MDEDDDTERAEDRIKPFEKRFFPKSTVWFLNKIGFRL